MTLHVGTLRIEVQTRRVIRRRNRRVTAAMPRALAVEPVLGCAIACSAVTVLIALARLGGVL